MCKKFSEFWDLYNQSFPADERRDLNSQKEIIQDSHYDIECFYEDRVLKGFCAIWTFPEFIFVDHIAVSPLFRGQGIGSEIMNKLITKSKKPIILEVERPDTETAERRIKFYEKLDFKLNHYDYLQPALGKDKSKLSLYLMSHPNSLNSDEYTKAKESIYQAVYQVNN